MRKTIKKITCASHKAALLEALEGQKNGYITRIRRKGKAYTTVGEYFVVHLMKEVQEKEKNDKKTRK